MESIDKWNKDFIALRLLDKKLNSKRNGRTGKHLQNTFKIHGGLQSAITRSECATGSCPNLLMSRQEQPEQRQVAMALSPQLPPRANRPLCLSVSSDSSVSLKALETQEWKNNFKAQMEQAHSAGAASSTGSLERASLFCASGSTTASSSGLSSPVEPLSLSKNKSSSAFSRFSPPWNSSSESDSNPPSRSSSKKWRNRSRRGRAGGGAGVGVGGAGGRGEEATEPKQGGTEQFQHSEPVISKVTDCIYVGNVNAAYSGRTLCRNNIDSVVDMSSLPGESSLCLVPCTCSRRARHTWSRLKVDLGDRDPALERRSFEDINECIAASAEKRRRVLVHCRDGYSLAPTCVIQYLMVRHNMRLVAAYELLRARHPVNITESHQNLLIGLEKALWPAASVDPESCKQAISRRVAWT
ncbi:uncharacterized protein LOC118226761 [Anguilla anguilla]|uniref:uncharacterized protein LOC118226761 n=1 Tax=Anguilla anguilla TaxID=7936 RepID=UPI0015A9F781|nr:uncharacterized protein LOC118226761 [Anguilla anguilla]XP_035272512.1 uncharacterized protein LOC118226761 [Anguilla anguilla]